MAKVKYVVIGFGGIAENRVAKEGYACDKARFKPLRTAQLVQHINVLVSVHAANKQRQHIKSVVHSGEAP